MSAGRQRQRDQVRGSVYSDKIGARSFRSPDNPFHTAHLLCNLITDERVSVDPSPPEHCQVLLLLWQRGMSAATVSVLQLAISLKKKKGKIWYATDYKLFRKHLYNSLQTESRLSLFHSCPSLSLSISSPALLCVLGMRKHRDDFQLIKRDVITVNNYYDHFSWSPGMWHNIRKAAFKVSKYFIIVRRWFQLSNACSLKHRFCNMFNTHFTINTKRLCGFYYCQCFNILTNRIAVKNYIK